MQYLCKMATFQCKFFSIFEFGKKIRGLQHPGRQTHGLDRNSNTNIRKPLGKRSILCYMVSKIK